MRVTLKLTKLQKHCTWTQPPQCKILEVALYIDNSGQERSTASNLFCLPRGISALLMQTQLTKCQVTLITIGLLQLLHRQAVVIICIAGQHACVMMRHTRRLVLVV